MTASIHATAELQVAFTVDLEILGATLMHLLHSQDAKKIGLCSEGSIYRLLIGEMI